MFDALRDDQELALLDPYVTVLKFHAEPALDHEEQFVLDIVMVPDEWTGELDQLDLLTIQFPDHPRLEMIGEQGELLQEADLFHADSLTRVDLELENAP